MSTKVSLTTLGWRQHFQSQVDSDSTDTPARIMRVHRGRVEIARESGYSSIELHGNSASLGLTVGDWVLLDAEKSRITTRLQAFALFQRRAAGSAGDIQAIAANVDTLFIVTSANRDFNIARLERYLAIAHDARAFPVIVITKTDLAESPQDFVAAAREDDQRGRHTTTSRSMHLLPDGGWLIDTPGMRELQLVDVGDALDDVFSDVAALAGQCRFTDCGHESEPGCAVQAAIASDTLDPERLRRFQKLQLEDRHNTESIAERRSRDKHFGKLIKSVIVEKKKHPGGR